MCDVMSPAERAAMTDPHIDKVIHDAATNGLGETVPRPRHPRPLPNGSVIQVSEEEYDWLMGLLDD